jgi:hypothetical protein
MKEQSTQHEFDATRQAARLRQFTAPAELPPISDLVCSS